MLYLTAVSNKKWPITTSEDKRDPSDGDIHLWDSVILPIVTTLPIVPGDLGTSEKSGYWAVSYDNIICLPTDQFDKILIEPEIRNSETLRSIVRKIGIGCWPIVLMDAGDKELKRMKLIERIHVTCLDPFPHSCYSYTIFVKDVMFVNNASMVFHVPHDFVWHGDTSEIGQVCHKLYHDQDYRRHEFTDAEITKIKIDLEAMGLKFDVAFLDGNHHVIRFYTKSVDGYLSWYQNRLDPNDNLYDIDISRQIKEAEGTYGIIRKKEPLCHDPHKHGDGHHGSGHLPEPNDNSGCDFARDLKD